MQINKKRLFHFFGITFLLLVFSVNGIAQDSLVKSAKQVKRHSPKKAALFSALLPGAGQAYNRKYWKMPLIYAGFAGLGYAIQFNNKKYALYRDAYRLRVDSDPNTIDAFDGLYSNTDLVTLKNSYHRYRDLSIIGAVALYFLNIIDANVDAHLFTFDVSDDLSFNFQPYYNTFPKASVKGLTITVKL